METATRCFKAAFPSLSLRSPRPLRALQFCYLPNLLIGVRPESGSVTTFFTACEEYRNMEQDDLIFLGAAVLLGQMVSQRPPDQSEIRAAVQAARNLRDEVNQQHEEARARKEPKKS
jgi:hypothetical protein